jgi:hypothetical protein
MTVYVDDYRLPATVDGVTGAWSHLMADSESEVRAFAHRIGVDRVSTYRSDVLMPRFAVTEAERRRAIDAGAIQVTVDQARSLVVARERIEAEAVQVAEEALRWPVPTPQRARQACRSLTVRA